MSLDFIGLFLVIAGFAIGLGAVTVIDLHGFLGRKSAYWTEATTRAHKVTKPLIWIGMTLATVGGFIFYRESGLNQVTATHLASMLVMILNGVFLSFVVSPFLLQREKEGRSGELLPANVQVQVTVAFIISFVCWWGNVLLFIFSITSRFV
jgi:hypothetical protein